MNQNKNGRAFEFACLKAVEAAVRHDILVVRDDAYSVAERSYRDTPAETQQQMDLAARTGIRIILPLEPKIENGQGLLRLYVASDAMAVGIDGDVRDVFCHRPDDGNWVVGFSCKHNHEALRHPRITADRNFGGDWVGYSVSREFLNEVGPVLDTLNEYAVNGIKWRDLPDKYNAYYVPILEAYVREIERLCQEHDDVPGRLLAYFFGSNDFYKIIMKASGKRTTVQGFSQHGTLNAASRRETAALRIQNFRMPRRLLRAEVKEESNTTIMLYFDCGWTVSMRLHNKDSIAKPTGLAWDVQLAGMPPSIFNDSRRWE